MEQINQGVIFKDTSEIETILKSFNSVIDVPTSMVIGEEVNEEGDVLRIRFFVVPFGAQDVRRIFLVIFASLRFESEFPVRGVRMINGRRKAIEG